MSFIQLPDSMFNLFLNARTIWPYVGKATDICSPSSAFYLGSHIHSWQVSKFSRVQWNKYPYLVWRKKGKFALNIQITK